MNDTRPTLGQLMNQYGISLKRLVIAARSVKEQEVLMVATSGQGTVEAIDGCLMALSSLTKKHYTRRHVGGFQFRAKPGMEPEVAHLRIPVEDSQHYLEQFKAHQAFIGEIVQPGMKEQEGHLPPAYYPVMLPYGTSQAFLTTRNGETSSDIVASYFPDGYVLHTRITYTRHHLYDVILKDWTSDEDAINCSGKRG